jgi:hypothetical protein
MLHHVLIILEKSAYVIMSGKEGYLVAGEDINQLITVDDIWIIVQGSMISAIKRGVLGNIDVSIIVNVFHKRFNPLQDLLCIAFLVAAARVINNVVEDNHDVLPNEECIVGRTKVSLVCMGSLSVVLEGLVMVMISD